MKKRDFILIGIVLAIAAVALFVWLSLPRGSYVVVTVGSGQDRREIARYYLSEDGEYSLNGGTNVLQIKDGKAKMIEANCPQNDPQACTKHAEISKVGETIACSPNNLVVEVHGADSEDSDVELVIGQ